MVNDTFTSLKEVRSTTHCKMCNADYTADFHQRVEVSFSLAKDIETLNLPPFCVPPPSIPTFLELNLPYQSKETRTIELETGEYRFFCPITNSKGILKITEEITDEVQELKIFQLDNNSFNIEEVELKKGKIKITASNPSVPISGLFIHKNQLNQELSLQELKPRLTGLTLSHFPLFTKLFSTEVLSNRERLVISSVTIVFTDITASTQMYEKLGDAKAYNIVRDHFDILIQEFQKFSGIIIKTIGDAVMASFIDNQSAISAIFSSIQAFNEYNQTKDINEKIQLKIGLHKGPAILVNLNDSLDYFGSTINKAARIQMNANANELCFSEEIFFDKSIRKFLKEKSIKNIYRIKRNLKGIQEEQTLFKISLV
jgi:hypothetical protein